MVLLIYFFFRTIEFDCNLKLFLLKYNKSAESFYHFYSYGEYMGRFCVRINALNIIKFIVFEAFIIYIFIKDEPDKMNFENIAPFIIFLLLGVIIGFFQDS